MSTIIPQNAENTNNNISIIKNRIKNLINKYILNNLIVTEELVEKIKSDRILKDITIVEISSRLNEAKEDDKILYLKLGIQIDSSYFIKDIINHYNNNKNLTIISILIKNYIFNNYEDNKEVLLKIVSSYNDKDFINNLQKYLHNLISSGLTNEKNRHKYINLALYVLPQFFLKEVIQDYINNQNEQLLYNRLELFDWNDDKNLNILLDYLKSNRDIPVKILDILKESNKKKITKNILSQNGRLKREYYYFEFGVLLKNKTKKNNNYKVNDSNINSKNFNRQVNSISETNYDLLSYEELPFAEFDFSKNDKGNNKWKNEKANKIINNDNILISNNNENYYLKEFPLIKLEKVVGTLIGKYLKEKDEKIINEIKSYANYSRCLRPNILGHLQKKGTERYSKYEYLVLGLKIDNEYFGKWIKKEKDRFSSFINNCKLTNDLDINPIVQKLNFEDNEILKIIQDKILSTQKYSIEWQKYIKIGLYFNINLYISDLIEDCINNRENSILIFFISYYENHFKELVDNFFDKLIDFHLYENQLRLDINNLANFYEILTNNYSICLKEKVLKVEETSKIINLTENIIYKRFCKRLTRRSNQTFSHKLIKIGILMIPKFFIKEFIDDYHNNKNKSILFSILNNYRFNNNIEYKILYRFYKSCFDKEFLLIVHQLIHKKIETIKNNINKKIKYLELGLSLDPKYYINFIIKFYYEIKNTKLLSLVNIFIWNNECFDIVFQSINNSEHIPNEILDKLINSDRVYEAKSLLEQKKDVLENEYLYFLSKTRDNSIKTLNNNELLEKAKTSDEPINDAINSNNESEVTTFDKDKKEEIVIDNNEQIENISNNEEINKTDNNFSEQIVNENIELKVDNNDESTKVDADNKNIENNTFEEKTVIILPDSNEVKEDSNNKENFDESVNYTSESIGTISNNESIDDISNYFHESIKSNTEIKTNEEVINNESDKRDENTVNENMVENEIQLEDCNKVYVEKLDENIIPIENEKEESIDNTNNTLKNNNELEIIDSSNEIIEEVENNNIESIESNIENGNLKEELENDNGLPSLRNALHCSPLSQQADSSPTISLQDKHGGASSVCNVNSKSNELSKIDVEVTEEGNDNINTEETITSENTESLENNDNIFNLSNLENNLYKAGVSESECKPFTSYFLSAYIQKIPILLAGPCGEQIANAFSISVCGAMPYIFDCKKAFNTALVDDMLKSENEVVIIKHPFATDWRETLLEFLSEGEKFYILTNPFYEDLQIEPLSLFNPVMPFITELIIDKPPVFETMTPTKIELPKHTNKFISMHNEILKEMKLSPYCINQIQTLLSEMHHILSEQLDKEKTGLPRLRNALHCSPLSQQADSSPTICGGASSSRNDGLRDNDSSCINIKDINKALELIDYKYVLFPYAYVTNQGDCIANKLLEVDKDAERYISKYFNIIKTAIEY